MDEVPGLGPDRPLADQVYGLSGGAEVGSTTLGDTGHPWPGDDVAFTEELDEVDSPFAGIDEDVAASNMDGYSDS